MACGRINLCVTANCGFRCCNFDENNYILLFPGELDKAIQSNYSIEHLTIIEEDELKGHKAICKAKDTSTCDNGYKPIDCQFYPFFPTIKDDEIVMLRGNKCPLKTTDIRDQANYVFQTIRKMICVNKETTLKWLRMVQLIGYRKDGDLSSEKV